MNSSVYDQKKRFVNPASPVLHVALIALLTVICYSNSFKVPFLFDDGASIERNPVIRDLGNFFLNDSGYRFNPGRFIGYLSFAANFRFGALQVAGYHAVNLAIHLVNSLLVYALARIGFRALPREGSQDPATPWIALFAALLFAVHPLQTEAVTYVVQRLTSLTATFYLLAMVCYARMRQLVGSPGAKLRASIYYLLCFCSVLLAMKTKEIAFTLPLALCLYETLFQEGRPGQRLRLLLPLLLTLPVIPLGMLTVGKPLGALISDVAQATKLQTSLPRWDYLVTQFSVITTYLRLIFLPVGQNIDYDYPVYHSLFAPRVLICFLILSSLLVLAVYLLLRSYRRPDLDAGASAHDSARLRLIAFGLLWFFLTLSVESSLVPIADVIFEHRVYLPCVGMFLCLAASGALLWRKFPGASLHRAFVALSAAIILLLAATTWARNKTWGDGIGFWQDVVSKSPGKSRPYINLGMLLSRAGRNEEALASYQQAARIVPDSAEALNNEAAALSALGRFQEAQKLLLRTIAVHPEHADAYYNLGRIYLLYLRKNDAAIAMLRQASALDPEHLDALVNLAAAYNLERDYPATVRLLEPAMAGLCGRADAHLNLGVAYAGVGNLRAAQREIALLGGMNPRMAAQLEQFLDFTRTPVQSSR